LINNAVNISLDASAKLKNSSNPTIILKQMRTVQHNQLGDTHMGIACPANTESS
jgi:hypothetical protein